MQVEVKDGEFTVDAALLGPLLGLSPAEVSALSRSSAITSVCERGEKEHAGEFRLTFFYGTRRARMSIDPSGKVLRRSSVDFGERAALRDVRRAR